MPTRKSTSETWHLRQAKRKRKGGTVAKIPHVVTREFKTKDEAERARNKLNDKKYHMISIERELRYILRYHK